MAKKRPETSRFSFTVARLTALTIPAKGRTCHHDAKMRGLCLFVTATAKTYYYYRWANGAPQKVRLGKFPDVSIEDARAAAAEMAGEIARGRDPAAERRARRESPTLEDLFNHWWNTHSKNHKKTWETDKRIFDNYLGKHRNRQLNKISKADVQKWHAKIGEDCGRYQANRVRSLLSAMFNAADGVGHTGPNPCVGVKQFREESRERFLQPDETKAFFQALAVEEPVWRDFFLLLLFTGARRGNVAKMRWENIDLDRGIWQVSGREMKGGLPVVVVLPEPAVVVLRARRKADPGGEWVFPSRWIGGPIRDPRKAWNRLRKRSGLADLRMHDLRRSLGSWQASLGTSLTIIGKALGHRDHKATEVYARLQVDPVKAAVNGAVGAIIEAGSVEVTADGLQLTDEGGDDDDQE